MNKKVKEKQSKNVKKIYRVDKKNVKIFTEYFISHPFSIIKGFFLLLIKGPTNFFDKLRQIENRQKNNKKNRYYKILKVFFGFKFFIKLAAAFLYFIIFFVYFLFFKIISLISSLIPKQDIKTKRLDLNGISFVIPTWNKKDLIIHCINSLTEIINSERGNVPIEIIVVENGSTDGSYEALQNLKNSFLKIVRSETNLGFAKGINFGVSKSKYNYVYLMNNDMIPKKEMLSSLIKYAKKLLKERIIFSGISSQIFFFDPNKRREESGKNYYKEDFGFLSVAHCINDNLLTKPSITGYPGGGSSLINKEIFQLFGGYDYDLYFPLYDEDLDFGFLAWRFGFPSFFLPESQTLHYHRSSSKKLNIDPSYFMYKNWLTFILKHYSSWDLIVRHLIFYPMRMLFDKRFIVYALENLRISAKIFWKKTYLLKYKEKYVDKELINFPKFELSYYEQK